jgi:UDP-N-acetylmuramoyl-tripeptide--D-alanyl-D-alanine ligase
VRPTPLREVAAALDAALHGADAGSVIRGAVVDSRVVRPGDLFFALRGRMDGADFAPEAIQRGAVAAVADRPLGVPTLVVEKPLDALQEMARWSLALGDPTPTVVGITGSVGKTTAKDTLAAVLRVSGRKVSATEGNFNNEIGLPLTVITAAERTETLVLEMGATHPGDIRRLCSIAPPRVGVLTAVSPVHLESFGGLEALAAAKGELALALPEDGAFVHPVGVPDAARGSDRDFGCRIAFSRSSDAAADLWATEIEEREDGMRFTLNYGDSSVEVRSPVFGTHLVEPMLAAFGGALAMGVSLEECSAGVARLKRTGLRGEVYRLRDDVMVYDDSYNASPTAVAAVLRYAAEQAEGQGRRLVAVLGGMFELGATARAYHHEAGQLAGELGVNLLVCVGEEARWYAETFPGEKVLCSEASEAAERLKEVLKPGDYVVVKGSRGVGLDTLTHELRESLALV